MQNSKQKFGQSSVVFKKPGILSKNLKTLTSSNYPTVQQFLLKLCTRLLFTNVYNFFYFVQTLSYLQKLKKPGFYGLIFYIFINNSRSRQNKKNPEHSFVYIIKQKTCKISAKNIKLYGSWSSSKFSIFQTKNLRNNRHLS